MCFIMCWQRMIRSDGTMGVKGIAGNQAFQDRSGITHFQIINLPMIYFRMSICLIKAICACLRMRPMIETE